MRWFTGPGLKIWGWGWRRFVGFAGFTVVKVLDDLMQRGSKSRAVAVTFEGMEAVVIGMVNFNALHSDGVLFILV
jgi:hypothetical protein